MNSRLLRRSASFLGALALAACSDDGPDHDTEMVRAAERARELPFLRAPRIERQTRATFIATADERGRAASDDAIAELRAVQGRLGFIPKSYDTRKADGEVASLVGAWYSYRQKAITLFERPEDRLYVHELVHALDDQHFDLEGYEAATRSTDAFLARRAVVEGDATLAEGRFVTGGSFRVIQDALSFSESERRAEEILSTGGTPPYFLASFSFVYTYGATFVARTAGISDGAFVRDRIDALFGDAAPKSTEDVFRRAQNTEVDPIEPVGLAAMPKELANDLDVNYVDCLGAWETFLLLREEAVLLPSRPTDVPRPKLSAHDLIKLWDGDQLVVIGERDRSVKPKRKPAVAIAWTSVWENEAAATAFVAHLQRVQDALSDGEEMILEQDAKQVVFVKGSIELAKMRTLADAALRRPQAVPPLEARVASPHLVLP